MKRIITTWFFIIFHIVSADSQVTPTIVSRSQGRDSARKIIGVSQLVHQFDMGNYITLSVTPEYTLTFRNHELARCLFGNDLINNCKILIQGSDLTGNERNPNAWLADYFYLAPDFDSHFTIKPSIQNFLVDLDLYVGLDEIAQGMYIRLHGPIAWTKWNLNFEESCDIQTSGSYIAGYFDHSQMLNNELLQTFGDFATGNLPLNRSNSASASQSAQPTTGVQFLGLQFAQIDRCDHSRTGFADLRIELGWDFFQNDDYHFGLNAQIAAPTGNRTEALFAFDPVVGNRNHWETGGGLTGHYTFWYNEQEDKQAGIYFDLSITHINNGSEQRTFDLCGKPNSRYMLATEFGSQINTPDSETFLITGAPTFEGNAYANFLTIPVSKVFRGVITPVANLTTFNIDVRATIQADLALMLHYNNRNWGVDIGYNLWTKSCEKFGNIRKLSQCCPSLCDQKDTWALKGDSQLFGYQKFGPFVSSGPAFLSATQSQATIHEGSNSLVAGSATCPGNRIMNCGIDNFQFAYIANLDTDMIDFNTSEIEVDGVILNQPGLGLGLNPPESNGIFTSVQPVFLNCCDINLQATRGISHKVFFLVSHAWKLHKWAPYLGIGGFAEFGNTDSCNVCIPKNTDQQCDTTSCEPICCSECLDCAVSQWGIWLKGGINFE